MSEDVVGAPERGTNAKQAPESSNATDIHDDKLADLTSAEILTEVGSRQLVRRDECNVSK